MTGRFEGEMLGFHHEAWPEQSNSERQKAILVNTQGQVTKGHIPALLYKVAHEKTQEWSVI